MRYANARRLHNGDEVTIKDTGEVVRVIEIEDIPSLRGVHVFVESPLLGYIKLYHKWVA